MRYRAEHEFLPGAVDSVPPVPVGWTLQRLKTVATYRVSSVDKVPSDDEQPVRLCNYTDVYYNEIVHPGLELMQTTATPEEIRRFHLQVEDVLITKDSESWSDIAKPALVVETADDFVCGYHLAIVRPNPAALTGRFLLRLFQSSAVNQQFQSAATGVTRYGLPKSAIGEAWIPLPPMAEQRAITDFLDDRLATIDRINAALGTHVPILHEYRTAVITAAVTGRIDVRGAAP